MLDSIAECCTQPGGPEYKKLNNETYWSCKALENLTAWQMDSVETGYSTHKPI